MVVENSQQKIPKKLILKEYTVQRRFWRDSPPKWFFMTSDGGSWGEWQNFRSFGGYLLAERMMDIFIRIRHKHPYRIEYRIFKGLNLKKGTLETLDFSG